MLLNKILKRKTSADDQGRQGEKKKFLPYFHIAVVIETQTNQKASTYRFWFRFGIL